MGGMETAGRTGERDGGFHALYGRRGKGRADGRGVSCHLESGARKGGNGHRRGGVAQHGSGCPHGGGSDPFADLRRLMETFFAKRKNFYFSH